MVSSEVNIGLKTEIPFGCHAPFRALHFGMGNALKISL